VWVDPWLVVPTVNDCDDPEPGAGGETIGGGATIGEFWTLPDGLRRGEMVPALGDQIKNLAVHQVLPLNRNQLRQPQRSYHLTSAVNGHLYGFGRSPKYTLSEV